MNKSDEYRKFKFVTTEIDKGFTFLCVFETLTQGDPEVAGEQTPVCWKVVRFDTINRGTAVVEYTANFAFFIPENENGAIVGKTYRACKRYMRVDLEKGKDGKVGLSRETDGTSFHREFGNTVDAKSSIGLGIIQKAPPDFKVEPLLVWKDVSPKTLMTVNFVPRMKIYAAGPSEPFSEKPGQPMAGEPKQKLVWQGNIIELQPVSIFNIEYDKSGIPSFKIK